MADLPANTNQTPTQDSTKQDNKFDKLTPILEYSYIVLYNMLNTLRSMKNYVDIYAQDMRLTDLEQYDKASVTLEKAIEDLTNAGKNIGSIYGLPEEMLDPQKMAQELAKQMKNMPMPQAPASQPSAQPQQPSAPAAQSSASSTSTATTETQAPAASTQQPTSATQPTSPATPAATQPPATTVQPASTPAASETKPNASTSTDNPSTSATDTNTKTSSNEDEEIKKILEQLKALRQ